MSVALLIPCYRAAAFLPELFAGVRAQTVPFDEVLCYDNASDDDSAAVARALGATVIAGAENRGPAFARNRLLDATRCDRVHFHDADDLIDPRFVERLTAVAGDSDACVLCAMAVADRATRAPVKTVRYRELPAAADAAAWFVGHNGYAIVGLYPTAVLRRIGGFDETLVGNEDPDLHVRLALGGAAFRVCDETLVTNLVRPDSYSRQNWTACLCDRVRCLDRYATDDAPPERRTAVGVEALSTAEALLEAGAPAAARSAIAVATRCGVTAVDSPRWWSRATSRVLGAEAVFRLRKWKRDLTA